VLLCCGIAQVVTSGTPSHLRVVLVMHSMLDLISRYACHCCSALMTGPNILYVNYCMSRLVPCGRAWWCLCGVVTCALQQLAHIFFAMQEVQEAADTSENCYSHNILSYCLHQGGTSTADRHQLPPAAAQPFLTETLQVVTQQCPTVNGPHTKNDIKYTSAYTPLS
jgi:hypothetical protein